MSEQEQIKAISEDLDYYFDNSRPGEDEHNERLAKPFIDKWGGRIISMGLAWIVHDLRKLTNRTIRLSLVAPDLPERSLDNTIYDRAMVTMGCMHDLVHAFGKDASRWLGAFVSASTDEDVRALAAYMLASDAFVHPGLREFLQEAFSKTEGTSCRLALALALYKCGDDKHLKSFVAAGYLASREGLRLLEDIVKKVAPRLDKKRREALLITELVFPGMTGLIPEALTVRRRGVMEILAMDIGSDGMAYRDNPSDLPWKRKQYD